MLCRFCKRQIADSTRICPYCLSDLLLGTPSDPSVSNSDVAPQQNEHTSETSLQKQRDDLYKNSAQTWESKHSAAANKEETDSAVHQTNSTPFTANALKETVTAASLQASLDASLQHFLYEQDTAPNKSPSSDSLTGSNHTVQAPQKPLDTAHAQSLSSHEAPTPPRDPFLATPNELLHDAAFPSFQNGRETMASHDNASSFHTDQTNEHQSISDNGGSGMTQQSFSFLSATPSNREEKQQRRISNNAVRDDMDKPLSTGAWFGYSLLFGIPLIGWLLAIIFSCAARNQNVRCFARSRLLLLLLGIALCIGTGFLLWYYAPSFLDHTIFPLLVRLRDWVASIFHTMF
ncbi:MAG: hypothetical protein KHW87_05650 [Clostridiales bacterium]|nr:hypothetical protein [Clostridiales bacterium]